MSKNSKIKKARGIIIWDFDRVLFDTDQFRKDHDSIYKRYSILPRHIAYALNKIKQHDGFYSLKRLEELLRKKGLGFPARAVRRNIHALLLGRRYLDPVADKILHRLRREGFLHMILSFGSPPYQYKKMKTGCGSNFLRHFSKVMVTRGSKYPLLRRVMKQNPSLPVFFIDDTKEHIALVKKYVPEVRTIHYTPRWSLQKVAAKILEA